MSKKQMIKEVKEAIKNNIPVVDVNLINCGEAGKEITRLLEEAGYTPDNRGPQREYRK